MRLLVTVLAATHWKSNAELIRDCFKLGYLKTTDRILDPTWGRGTWWHSWSPVVAMMILSDQETSAAYCEGHDFRKMSFPDNYFDAVAFDPPYVSVGGRTTTGIVDMHDHYGLTDAPTSPKGVQDQIDAGLLECTRVLKPRGHLLVKCQPYISSGKYFAGDLKTAGYAIGVCDLILVDRFIHLTHPRPQPQRDRQVHARNNWSTLFIFQKGKK